MGQEEEVPADLSTSNAEMGGTHRSLDSGFQTMRETLRDGDAVGDGKQKPAGRTREVAGYEGGAESDGDEEEEEEETSGGAGAPRRNPSEKRQMIAHRQQLHSEELEKRGLSGGSDFESGASHSHQPEARRNRSAAADEADERDRLHGGEEDGDADDNDWERDPNQPNRRRGSLRRITRKVSLKGLQASRDMLAMRDGSSDAATLHPPEAIESEPELLNASIGIRGSGHGTHGHRSRRGSQRQIIAAPAAEDGFSADAQARRRNRSAESPRDQLPISPETTAGAATNRRNPSANERSIDHVSKRSQPNKQLAQLEAESADQTRKQPATAKKQSFAEPVAGDREHKAPISSDAALKRKSPHALREEEAGPESEPSPRNERTGGRRSESDVASSDTEHEREPTVRRKGSLRRRTDGARQGFGFAEGGRGAESDGTRIQPPRFRRRRSGVGQEGGAGGGGGQFAGTAGGEGLSGLHLQLAQRKLSASTGDLYVSDASQYSNREARERTGARIKQLLTELDRFPFSGAKAHAPRSNAPLSSRNRSQSPQPSGTTTSTQGQSTSDIKARLRAHKPPPTRSSTSPSISPSPAPSAPEHKPRQEHVRGAHNKLEPHQEGTFGEDPEAGSGSGNGSNAEQRPSKSKQTNSSAKHSPLKAPDSDAPRKTLQGRPKAGRESVPLQQTARRATGQPDPSRTPTGVGARKVEGGSALALEDALNTLDAQLSDSPTSSPRRRREHLQRNASPDSHSGHSAAHRTVSEERATRETRERQQAPGGPEATAARPATAASAKRKSSAARKRQSARRKTLTQQPELDGAAGGDNVEARELDTRSDGQPEELSTDDRSGEPAASRGSNRSPPTPESESRLTRDVHRDVVDSLSDPRKSKRTPIKKASASSRSPRDESDPAENDKAGRAGEREQLDSASAPLPPKPKQKQKQKPNSSAAGEESSALAAGVAATQSPTTHGVQRSRPGATPEEQAPELNERAARLRFDQQASAAGKTQGPRGTRAGVSGGEQMAEPSNALVEDEPSAHLTTGAEPQRVGPSHASRSSRAKEASAPTDALSLPHKSSPHAREDRASAGASARARTAADGDEQSALGIPTRGASEHDGEQSGPQRAEHRRHLRTPTPTRSAAGAVEHSKSSESLSSDESAGGRRRTRPASGTSNAPHAAAKSKPLPQVRASENDVQGTRASNAAAPQASVHVSGNTGIGRIEPEENARKRASREMAAGRSGLSALEPESSAGQRASAHDARESDSSRAANSQSVAPSAAPEAHARGSHGESDRQTGDRKSAIKPKTRKPTTAAERVGERDEEEDTRDMTAPGAPGAPRASHRPFAGLRPPADTVKLARGKEREKRAGDRSDDNPLETPHIRARDAERAAKLRDAEAQESASDAERTPHGHSARRAPDSARHPADVNAATRPAAHADGERLFQKERTGAHDESDMLTTANVRDKNALKVASRRAPNAGAHADERDDEESRQQPFTAAASEATAANDSFDEADNERATQRAALAAGHKRKMGSPKAERTRRSSKESENVSQPAADAAPTNRSPKARPGAATGASRAHRENAGKATREERAAEGAAESFLPPEGIEHMGSASAEAPTRDGRPSATASASARNASQNGARPMKPELRTISPLKLIQRVHSAEENGGGNSSGTPTPTLTPKRIATPNPAASATLVEQEREQETADALPNAERSRRASEEVVSAEYTRTRLLVTSYSRSGSTEPSVHSRHGSGSPSPMNRSGHLSPSPGTPGTLTRSGRASPHSTPPDTLSRSGRGIPSPSETLGRSGRGRDSPLDALNRSGQFLLDTGKEVGRGVGSLLDMLSPEANQNGSRVETAASASAPDTTSPTRSQRKDLRQQSLTKQQTLDEHSAVAADKDNVIDRRADADSSSAVGQRSPERAQSPRKTLKKRDGARALKELVRAGEEQQLDATARAAASEAPDSLAASGQSNAALTESSGAASTRPAAGRRETTARESHESSSAAANAPEGSTQSSDRKQRLPTASGRKLMEATDAAANGPQVEPETGELSEEEPSQSRATARSGTESAASARTENVPRAEVRVGAAGAQATADQRSGAKPAVSKKPTIAKSDESRTQAEGEEQRLRGAAVPAGADARDYANEEPTTRSKNTPLSVPQPQASASPRTPAERANGGRAAGQPTTGPAKTHGNKGKRAAGAHRTRHGAESGSPEREAGLGASLDRDEDWGSGTTRELRISIGETDSAIGSELNTARLDATPRGRFFDSAPVTPAARATGAQGATENAGNAGGPAAAEAAEATGDAAGVQRPPRQRPALVPDTLRAAVPQRPSPLTLTLSEQQHPQRLSSLPVPPNEQQRRPSPLSRPEENNGKHNSAASANISGGSEEGHTGTPDTKHRGPPVAPKRVTRTGHADAGSPPAQAAESEPTTGAGGADEGVLEAKPRAARQSLSELFAEQRALGLGDTGSLRDADADAVADPTTRQPKSSSDSSRAEAEQHGRAPQSERVAGANAKPQKAGRAPKNGDSDGQEREGESAANVTEEAEEKRSLEQEQTAAPGQSVAGAPRKPKRVGAGAKARQLLDPEQLQLLSSDSDAGSGIDRALESGVPTSAPRPTSSTASRVTGSNSMTEASGEATRALKPPEEPTSRAAPPATPSEQNAAEPSKAQQPQTKPKPAAKPKKPTKASTEKKPTVYAPDEQEIEVEQEVEVEVDVEVTDSSSSAPSPERPTSTSVSVPAASTPSRVEQKFAEVVDAGSGKLRMWSESGEMLSERVAQATPGVVRDGAQQFRVEVSELREQVYKSSKWMIN